MPNLINLAGQRFGRLLVIERQVAPTQGNRSVPWVCKCDCGNILPISSQSLRNHRTQSCGCLNRENLANGGGKLRHGATRHRIVSPEYRIWIAMRQRCSNPKTNKYARYGGRGISVCRRWGRFENFLADMGLRPSRKHSIHRINNDGNYTPGNCVWATPKEQAKTNSGCFKVGHK